MPVLHDFRCSAGHTFERMARWNVDHVLCSCGAVAERVFLPRSRNAQNFAPVVVFKKADGGYIFPGRANESTPKGCQRVELRDIHAVRRFERDENARLKNIHQASMERQGVHYQAVKREMREQLREQLGRMSPKVRKLAEVAMAESDKRESHSSRAARFDANFRIQSFSDDRSNRDAWIDRDTGWKRARE